MVRKLRWPALGLAFVMAAGISVAEAQVNATVVTKSGERHTGRNVGFRTDRGEVSVRTSQHEEPRLKLDQVAYIEFGGTPQTQVSLSGSQHAVVLRDGTVHKGQVIEIGHTNPGDESTPFLVTFRTEGGEERRLPVSQVGRVYFSDQAATATSGQQGQAQLESPTGDGITVSARQQWTPTGLMVRSGDRLTFQTSGEIQLSNNADDVAGPAGARSQRKATGAPLPQNFAGALIARVGTGQPFPIGDQTSVTMPANGQLFLGINDDELNDNRGEFRVKIQRQGRR